MKNTQKTILFAFLIVFLSTTTVLAIEKTTTKNPPISPRVLHEKIIKKETRKPHIPQKTDLNRKAELPEMRNNANGTIVSIEGNNIVVSPKQHRKDEKVEDKTIVVDEKTIINKDLNKITLTDLKVGDDIRVNLERLSKDTFRTRSIRVMTNETNNILKEIRARAIEINT